MTELTNFAVPATKSLFRISERDILSELLADKRSLNTRRAYALDLKDFFQASASSEPTPSLIRQFLELERFTAIGLVLQYKAELIERGLKEATVNRRLAAIKSLVKYAQKIGKCTWSLQEVEGEKVKQYRDTSGVNLESYRVMLAVPNRGTLKGKRDYAILRLLWENVLRRSEVCNANVEDFDPETKILAILGKGRGTQKELISLSVATVEAINMWLSSRGCYTPAAPLFIALDNGSKGHRLSGTAIYQLVSQTAEKAGIKKRISPHRIRHSGITAALDATNGNVREVKKLSRHARLDTLMVYDDNRVNDQKKITELLSGLL